MSDNDVFLLLTTGESGARVVRVRADIGVGVPGDAVRHVELPDSSADARASALAGALHAYSILYREKYSDREIVVRFAPDLELKNIHGRSADLAFALALAANWCGPDGRPVFRFPVVAATGLLSDDGGILPVECVAQKLAAAANASPAGSVVIYPRANDADVPMTLRREAADKGIVLAACDRLEEALQRLGARLSHSWLESPFRGLEPFGFAHASIFFGRDAEIEAVLALIQRRTARAHRGLLIEGPSGSGKSSLVLAGVIPALLRRGLADQGGENFRWGLFRARAVKPDVDLAKEAQSLAAALQQSWLHDQHGALYAEQPLTSVEYTLNPESFAAWLRTGTALPQSTRFVWVLDQMEEWFDGALQPATVSRLCAFLGRVADQGVILIGTITKGNADRLMEHPELAACFGIEGRFALDQPLEASKLDAVIHQPARAARLTFESGLDAEIFAAASHGGPDILPLLELLLTELFERRDRAHSLLRLADYRDVGGLDGVISARAENVYAQATPGEQAAVPRLLWNLETKGSVALSDFEPRDPILGLVAALRGKRLLVQDQDRDDHVSVRVAHDALLRHWSRAVEQRRLDGDDTRRWLDLMREAGQWARGERALIPGGPQLAAAIALYRRRLNCWTAGDQLTVDYVQASARQRSRRQLLAAVGVGIPTSAAAIVGGTMLARYIDDLRFRRINFDDVSVPPPDYVIAAAPYLKQFGIRLSSVDPDRCHLLIRSNVNTYGGRAVEGRHFLTEEAKPWAAPMSYTLDFDRAPTSVRLVRASLWAATSSGVTHPGWIAQAFDAGGREIARVQEDLLRSFTSVSAGTFLLQASDVRRIARLKVTSDFRLEGRPFAGFQAVLIKELHLAY